MSLRIIWTQVKSLLSRRLVSRLFLLLTVGCLGYGGYLFVSSRPLPMLVAVKVDEDLERVGKLEPLFIRQCLRGARRPFRPPNTRPRCDREWIEAQESRDRDRFHFARNQILVVNASIALLILGWLIGSTFAGANWTTGFVSTVLTWEPSRTRVFVGTLIALGLGCFVGAMLLQLLLIVGSSPAALARGSFVGVNSSWVNTTSLTMLRAGLVASMGAMMGGAVASIARSTAGALGVGLFLFFLQGPLSQVPSLNPFLVFNSVNSFVGTSLGLGPGLTTLQGGLQIAAFTGILTVAGWATFRFRDIAL